MAITTDLETALGQIRLLIGDQVENDGVKPNGGNFSDADLLHFYQREGQDVDQAAALACETLATLWTPQVSFSADGLQMERGSAAEGWARAARRLRANRGAQLGRLIHADAYRDPGEA